MPLKPPSQTLAASKARPEAPSGPAGRVRPPAPSANVMTLVTAQEWARRVVEHPEALGPGGSYARIQAAHATRNALRSGKAQDHLTAADAHRKAAKDFHPDDPLAVENEGMAEFHEHQALPDCGHGQDYAFNLTRGDRIQSVFGERSVHSVEVLDGSERGRTVHLRVYLTEADSRKRSADSLTLFSDEPVRVLARAGA